MIKGLCSFLCERKTAGFLNETYSMKSLLKTATKSLHLNLHLFLVERMLIFLAKEESGQGWICVNRYTYWEVSNKHKRGLTETYLHGLG